MSKRTAVPQAVDHESIEQFESCLSDNLYKLWNRLCSGSYFPPPVKGVLIPKRLDGVRMLGVPTVADRVAQTAVKLLLEPQIDPMFHPNSYGYRPGCSAHDAIALVRQRSWDYDWVVEFDIKGLFDNIDHDLLMRALKKHCQIPWILLYKRSPVNPGRFISCIGLPHTFLCCPELTTKTVACYVN